MRDTPETRVKSCDGGAMQCQGHDAVEYVMRGGSKKKCKVQLYER